MDIKETLRTIFKSFLAQEELYSLPCRVDSVDQDARVCDVTPLNGGAQISGVRLQADPDMTKGLVCFPEVGSNVMVSFINKNAAFVSLYSTIEKAQLKIGDTKIDIDAQGNVVMDCKGNFDVSAVNIFMGGNTGVVVAKGLPPGATIVEIGQLSVANKLKAE